jgi:hypothetical protein
MTMVTSLVRGKRRKMLSVIAFHMKFILRIQRWPGMIQEVFRYLDVSLTVYRSITLANDQLDAQIFNTFVTILFMYMFRAIPCSSSGGQTVLIQHLILSLSESDCLVHRLREFSLNLCTGQSLRVMIPDTVLIQFDLLRMSKVLLKTCTCRGL